MSFFWQESFGQIYPVLDALHTDGLIQKAESFSDKNRRQDKTSYNLTEKGRQELSQWFQIEPEKETIRNELLLKLYLSTDDDKAVMSNHLMTLNSQSSEKLELFRQFSSQLTCDIEQHRNHGHILDVLAFGMKLQELYISWSLEMIDKYASMEG
jgi:PadR family transcriptional regulator AphA